jgi:hypothetical protein
MLSIPDGRQALPINTSAVLEMAKAEGIRLNIILTRRFSCLVLCTCFLDIVSPHSIL